MKLHFSNKKQLFAFWLALALGVGALVWAVLRYVSPAPPRSVSMSTGAVDGAYHLFGLKYQAILKQNGINLVLLPSSGSLENIKRLNDGSATVALVQGGVGRTPQSAAAAAAAASPNAPVDEPDSPLRALATVGFEPVWIFSKKLDLSNGLNPLAGKRVAVGVAGSGNLKVALKLLNAYGVVNAQGEPVGTTQLVFEGGMVAAQRLQASGLDAVDAVILVAAPQAPAVAALLQDKSVTLASLSQTEGLARRTPYFQPVSLKMGSVNAQYNTPPRDITLLATTASLVIHQDLHPALAYLLLEAASQTHNRPSLLNRPGDFPSALGSDFALADEAERYFKNGRPFLQRYLPFWLANFVQRLVLVLVPLLALLFPLFKFMPVVLTWQQEKKLFRRYGELKFLEIDITSRQLNPADLCAAQAQLDRIEQEVVSTRFPLDFSDRVYTLRQHLDFVRAKLALHGAPLPVAPTPTANTAPRAPPR